MMRARLRVGKDVEMVMNPMQTVSEQVQQRMNGFGKTSMAEVFEYAGMVAAVCADVSSDRKPREAAIRRHLIGLASAVLLVLRDGDKLVGLEGEGDFITCTHDGAVAAYREGSYVQASHWSVAIRNVVGTVQLSSAVSSNLSTERMLAELLSGTRADGSSITWRIPHEEIPF